jgi:hypothetical protein
MLGYIYIYIVQQIRAGAGRAHPVPAEAHVRLRHLRLPGNREDHPVQGQPAFRVRRTRSRQALQGEGQGPRQVRACPYFRGQMQRKGCIFLLLIFV